MIVFLAFLGGMVVGAVVLFIAGAAWFGGR